MYLAVFGCLYTKNTHLEVIDTDAHNQDSAYIQELRDSEYVTQYDGKLHYSKGFDFTVFPVGCHARNGAAEIRVKAAKRLLGSMNMTTMQVTALDLQTRASEPQAQSIINSTPLGTMVRPASNKLSVVSPMDFTILGRNRRTLITSISFPKSLD